ncbi:MAG: glycosyltransferase family 2 protein, partial [Methylothermaceae bacterium]|nr:glycosyltransferase family 2 protein [Methylothermaceae bacterium]
MTRVSVIIPTHNRSALLREAITSIQNQTYPNWEVIIVDDGSQPPVDSESLHKDFGSRIRVLHNKHSVKQAYARDQGVQVATGEVVIHLDDDDLLAPNALEMGLAILEGDPSLELLYLNAQYGTKNFNSHRKSVHRSKRLKRRLRMKS